MSDWLKLLLEQLGHHWRTRTGAFLALVSGALSGYELASQITPLATPVGESVAAIAGALALSVLRYKTTRLGQTPRGMVGLVLAIKYDNRDHRARLRTDFVDVIRQLLNASQSHHFYLLDLDDYHSARISKENAPSILLATRSRFILHGSMSIRKKNGHDVHVVRLSACVSHSPIDTARSAALSQDMTSILPLKLEIPLDGDYLSFETTTQWLDVAARCVIGSAAAHSGDPTYAEMMFLSAEAHMSDASRLDMRRSRTLRDHIQKHLVHLYEAWSMFLASKHFSTRSTAFLIEGERIASRLSDRKPDSYNAALTLAMADFVLRRDVASAIRRLKRIERVPRPSASYGLGFLYAYTEKMELATESYRRAFSLPLDDVSIPNQCEEFISLIVESDPSKGQLRYYSGLINLRAKRDFRTALLDFRHFLAWDNSRRFPRQVKEARQHIQYCEQELRSLDEVGCASTSSQLPSRRSSLAP